MKKMKKIHIACREWEACGSESQERTIDYLNGLLRRHGVVIELVDASAQHVDAVAANSTELPEPGHGLGAAEIIGSYIDVRSLPAHCPFHETADANSYGISGETWQCTTCKAS